MNANAGGGLCHSQCQIKTINNEPKIETFNIILETLPSVLTSTFRSESRVTSLNAY